MGSEKSISKLFLILLGLSTLSGISSYLLPRSFFIGTYLTFLTIFLFGVTGILLLFFVMERLQPGSGIMMSDEEKKASGSVVEKDETMEKTESETLKTSDSSKQREGLFSKINPFSGKKKCDECGGELVFKEDYESYYCPNCRTYKR